MRTKRYRRGDRVQFDFCGRLVDGLVKEDRGAIGINGRRLYRVEFDTDSETPSSLEMPCELLQPNPQQVSAR